MNDFGVMQYAAAGMEAQRSALDVLAQNLALVQTADPKHPVHTLVPQFTSTPEGDEFAASLAAAGQDFPDDAPSALGSVEEASFDEGEMDHQGDGDTTFAPGPLPGQIAFAGVRPSQTAVTGVDAVSEMVGVLGAQRAFEASAAVFDTGKRLIEKTLSVEQGT